MAKQQSRKYKVGLIIGRFQPFHNGHLYLIKKALLVADKLAIGIGSSNVQNEDNFLSFEIREKMINKVFESEEIKDRIIKIVAIPDVPDDDEWLQIVKRRVGEFGLSIGNNDWVNGIFKKAGIPILRTPYFKRKILEGKKIRQFMRSGKSLSQRVPGYLSSSILGH